MDINKLTQENKKFIRTIFNEMRKKTNSFSIVRDFNMSNAQIFTFLSIAPAAFAAASDNVLDNNEIAKIEKLSRMIDVNSTVNLELMEMMSIAPEPENIMSNEEFNIRAGAELLYLARNLKKFEDDFISALKTLLIFDQNPNKPGSLTSSFIHLMDSMVKNNLSKNKGAEMIKLKEFKTRIGLN